MTLKHRVIPVLPVRPHVHPVSSHIYRSYSAGRQSFSRACQGQVMVLTITIDETLPSVVQARLMTTLNSTGGKQGAEILFTRTDERTLTCRVMPERLGLQSFRAEFSLDEGTTWLRDTIPDAWVLVDPPQVDGLRLYTLLPTVSGTIADWKADLGRIQKMGFNAVHLLPITAQDTSESPYAAADLFALDARYLNADAGQDGLSQFEEFAEEARALRIQLCFDLVLNHVGVHSAMARQAPDWIVPDQNQPDGLQRARYWSDQGWRTWDDLVLINYEHPSEAVRSEIWAYMTDYALFWSSYADDTGGFVRFDNLHSSNPDFIESLTTALHSQYPQVGLLAEYFTDERTLLNTAPEWGLNLLLATPWNYKFVPQLRDYLQYIHRVSGQVRYFMPITSQDSGAPAQEFGTADSTAPRYVAAALLGTGATGMPQGVELGESERINFIGSSPKLVFPADPRFASFIGRVNAILADYPAFRCGENCRFVDNGHPAVIAAFRQDPQKPASGFLVMCNFDTGSPQRVTVDLAPFLQENGPFPCRELLSGAKQIYPHPKFELRLAPCETQVFMFA
ncbi:MAG: alpha-amylase family glycosyl hydrolase [Janthinobacterium lividum]